MEAEACTDAGVGGRGAGWRMEAEAFINAGAGRLVTVGRVGA